MVLPPGAASLWAWRKEGRDSNHLQNGVRAWSTLRAQGRQQRHSKKQGMLKGKSQLGQAAVWLSELDPAASSAQEANADWSFGWLSVGSPVAVSQL